MKLHQAREVSVAVKPGSCQGAPFPTKWELIMIVTSFKTLLTAIAVIAFAPLLVFAEKPNILIITVDDMSCDSVGVFGCPIEGITPHIDGLASESMRFQMAHVQVGNCYPSRNVMFSGRYPHSSGVDGFYQVRDIAFPVMCDLMQGAGYYVGIRGKVSHSTPYQPYQWDADLTITEDGKKEHIKDVPSYYRSTKRGIDAATEKGKPFVLNINISDPHKPFWKPNDPHKVSKIYTSEDVPVPGFLWDDDVVKKELALYYTSVRRADDAVGEILRALKESGKVENTVVMFLSDHGMPLPFAKTQLYHHSTWTPWIVKWPGQSEAGSVDSDHMISAVDLLPTLCELVGAPIPEGVEGRSFLSLVRGEKQEDRDFVIKEYNENSGGIRHPIRGVQTPDYLYLFNPWSNGERRCRTATQGTQTYKRMQVVAKSDQGVAARLKQFDHRTLEELYDVKSDPDCLINLIDISDHDATAEKMRSILKQWMVDTGDPLIKAFNLRNDAAKLDALMDEIEAEGKARKAANRKKKKSKNKAKAKGKGNKGKKKAAKAAN